MSTKISRAFQTLKLLFLSKWLSWLVSEPKKWSEVLSCVLYQIQLVYHQEDFVEQIHESVLPRETLHMAGHAEWSLALLYHLRDERGLAVLCQTGSGT